VFIPLPAAVRPVPSATGDPPAEWFDMSSPYERPNVQRPPDWAVDQATDELDGVDDSAAVEERAWQLVHDAEQREEERHDEFDDPDQGGEA
jgi:hypothetical protein